MPRRYVNDAFTLDDGFGTTIAGDQVARMVLEVETPFTLGVTGKWGSGKTSVLRRAFVTLGGNPVALAVPLEKKEKEDTGTTDWERWRLQSRLAELGWKPPLPAIAERSLCVWYSPWQHQGADNPLVALLLEIRAQYTTWLRFKEGAKNWNRRGGLAGLALLERVIDGAVGLAAGRPVKLTEGLTDTVRKAWREAAPEEPALGDGQRFQLLFDDAIETLLSGLPQPKGGGVSGRLVVFIDDLDRCEESVVVQLLESIKLYLASPRCVFVLAIDEGAVLTALERHWKGRSEDANREYLEKLFQAIVPVPAPRPAAVQTFVEEQLKEHGFPAHADCARLVIDLLEPNPRKLKNFVNSACAGWGMMRAAKVPASEDPKRAEFAKRFLLFQYLRAQHKPVWRLLERQPWALRVLGKVLTGTVPQKLPEWVSWDQQRMLELLFVRAFAHVLGNAPEGLEDHHRYLPISEAVELANQRIDRKRSDDFFAQSFKALIGIDMDLPEELLGLPPLPAPPGKPAETHG